MSSFTFGLIVMLADLAPEPVSIGGGRLGTVVGGLALAAAVALVGVILIRGRGKKGGKK